MAVSYVDGVTGGNVFLITLDGARLLAASMMGMDEPEDPDATELSELELSAVSEAMNQMMASAAAATSVVLGTEVEIGTPETKTFTAADAIADAYPTTPARGARRRCRSAASPRGSSSSCRTPSSCACRARSTTSAPSVRRRRARRRRPGAARRAARRWPASRCASGPSSAARACPPRRSSGCPTGAVVELDKQADDAIDLFVNGTHFATGRLVVVDGTDWAVRIEHVLDTDEINTDSGMEVARWPESW